MSLRLKYAVYTAVLTLGVFTAFALVNYRFYTVSLGQELAARTEMNAEYIKASLYAHMLSGRSQNFQSFLETHAREDLEEVRVFDPEDGTIRASSIPKEVGNSIYPSDLETFKRDSKPRVFEHVKNGRTFLSKVEPLYNDVPCQNCHDPAKRVIGVLDIEISPERVLTHSLSDLRYITLVFLAASLLLSGGMLFIMTGRLVTTPLHAIMNAMQRVSRGDLSSRYHTARIDEIGHLASSLNTMVASMEVERKTGEELQSERFRGLERLASVGSMTTAIAHDIKNPLAGISGAVQVIAEDLPEEDPRREVIDEIQQRIRTLDRTIRDIRNYATPPSLQFIRIQADTVVESVVRVLNRDISSARAEVSLQLPSNAPEIELDPDRMQEAIQTLALYCLRHMKNGGRLILSCLRKDDLNVQIKVEGADGNVSPRLDDGLFDPLGGEEKPGERLALAAAKGIITQHRGIISVGPSPEGGVRFLIVVPVSQKLTHA